MNFDLLDARFTIDSVDMAKHKWSAITLHIYDSQSKKMLKPVVYHFGDTQAFERGMLSEKAINDIIEWLCGQIDGFSEAKTSQELFKEQLNRF